ncbi:hypothetical protein [Pelagicoccus mobilis]|uniref:MtrB/PioB family decaheme-associated outer membrane protein n=1 Tax=Pelagicoccus mobilis TaxID=415221 RepID=A0A934VTU5_9BACT|nr:hypothetical protein [Pelagicoccus mobilis]MBK1880088.1 hypothetical protein [Pelagicoccus mobilis]
MKNNSVSTILSASFVLAATFALASTTHAQDEQLPDTGNFIDVTLGHASHDGNEAAYLARTPIKKHAFGGIERFQYEGYVGDYTEFSVYGRAMHDNNDYLFGMEFLNEEVGFFNLEWKEYRIFYDGSGHYFPGGDTWIELYDDELALDRTRFQIAGGLFLDNFPDVSFSYTQLGRKGLKSSTALADTSLTGGFGTRNIVPAFWDIDETRHIFDFEATEKYSKTQTTLSLRAEENETDNARKMTRRPNEPSFRRITHRERFDTDLLSARFSSVTEIDEKTTFSAGIAYTEIDVNATGDRIINSEFDAPYDANYQGQRRDHGWIDLLADSQIDQWIINANLMTKPAKNWKAVYALRLEEMNTGIDSEFIETEFSTGSGMFEEHPIELNAERDWNDAAVSAEFIYTGIENVIYDGSVLYTTGDGDFMEEEFDAETSGQLLERLSNTERDVLKFALGAKFYPSSDVRWFVNYYHKERDNKYNHIIDPTEPDGRDRFPAYTDGQDFTTDDLNVSVRWKASKNVSALTRVDYQKSKIDSQGQGLEWALAYDREALIISQSVTAAYKAFFIQASAIYMDDERESPISSIGGGIADTLAVLDGDFWNGNVSVNWGINDDSNAAVNLFYNRVDNYVDNSEFGQPYGEDLEESGVSATYTRQLTDNAQLTLRYAYFESEDRASGGRNDYDAQILYSSIRYRF